MENLHQVVRAIQQDADALPTGALRTEIHDCLDGLDAAIGRLKIASRLGDAGSVDAMIDAVSDVMAAALTVALYVRELTTRPVDRFAQVRLSFN